MNTECHSEFVTNGSHYPCNAVILTDGTHPDGLHQSALIWEDEQVDGVDPPARALLTWEGNPDPVWKRRVFKRRPW